MSQCRSTSMGPVELVWSSASDGRWHSIDELARNVPLRHEMIALTISFLVRYGFARSSEMRFLIDPHVPPPIFVARRLRRVQFQRHSYSSATSA